MRTFRDVKFNDHFTHLLPSLNIPKLSRCWKKNPRTKIQYNESICWNLNKPTVREKTIARKNLLNAEGFEQGLLRAQEREEWKVRGVVANTSLTAFGEDCVTNKSIFPVRWEHFIIYHEMETSRKMVLMYASVF